MADLQGQGGELRMTLEIKRAATGKVETVELVGRMSDGEAEQFGLKEEAKHGCDSFDGE
jgi:hypothetical protein